jgi:hypothetical protein
VPASEAKAIDKTTLFVHGLNVEYADKELLKSY